MKTINATFATKFPLSKYFLENSEESNCNNVVTESKKRNTAPLSNGPHAHLNGYVDELKEGGHDGSKGHCAAENGSTEANQQQQKTCSPDAKTAVMVNGTVSNSNAANDDNCAMGDSQNPATINLNHSIWPHKYNLKQTTHRKVKEFHWNLIFLSNKW